MKTALDQHWPEYLIEAVLLGLFMISAGVFSMLIDHPASPVHDAIGSALARRALSGTAMGLTAIALIYSPWGRQSGAHFNPAVTLTFYRLKRISGWDALFYVLAQFAGGTLAVLLVATIAGRLFRNPPVNYVATLPGAQGERVAFAAELVISLLLMSAVLTALNHPRLSRFTGLMCGTLVALFITFESPLSGMSMNPARSVSSAAPGRMWGHLWIYFVAPVLGMLAAVELCRLLTRLEDRGCAKLCHSAKKRCIFCGHAMAALLLIIFSAPAHAAATRTSGVALTVSDLDRSVAFYRDVLSFRVCSTTSGSIDDLSGLHGTKLRIANLSLGGEQLQLIQFLTPQGRPYPSNSASNDLWFQHIAIVVSDMDKAYRLLTDSHVTEISVGPQRLPSWNKAAAGIRALYFRDPDQHPLEVIYFPQGKGDPKWQVKAETLFLGIDHTAIAVKDTDRSLVFYQRVLGFHIAGESLNYGIEQEHLNGVSGSRVRITGLRDLAGLGIELLQYVAPGAGRPIPADAAINDLWHAHVTLLLSNPADLAEIVKTRRIIPLGPLAPTLFTGAVIRDPDGHELLVRTQ